MKNFVAGSIALILAVSFFSIGGVLDRGNFMLFGFIAMVVAAIVMLHGATKRACQACRSDLSKAATVCANCQSLVSA